MSKGILEVRPSREDVKTGLDVEVRQRLATDLGRVLGNTYMLLVKTHVYHWNVVGPLFLPLHELTEEHYEDLFQAADELAERIRALGFVTPLNFASMADEANLEEEKKRETAEAMIEHLIGDHEALVRSARKIAEFAEENGDYVTHDILVGRMSFHEKAVWMLRAIVADR
jgi:starvation-inducible DNA-binding protein